MVEVGIVEPSSCLWGAPAVLVKTDTCRFFDDTCHFNNVTRKDSFPLPHTDNALDYIAGSHWFSSLDLHSGYWQVELTPVQSASVWALQWTNYL